MSFVFPIALNRPRADRALGPVRRSSPDDHTVDLPVLSPKPVLVVLRASQEVEDAVTRLDGALYGERLADYPDAELGILWVVPAIIQPA